MRKLPAFVFGGAAAAALAGTAIAAGPKTHVVAQTHAIDVPLPGGGVAHVEYVGDVAPKVTVAPGAFAQAGNRWGMMFPSFAGFDRMMAQMQRQSQEMMRHAQEIARRPAGAAPYIASYGNMPAGQTSTTVVSVSNNGVTCTRTTEVVSQGPGKAPKVTSNASGQCGESAAPAARPTHPA